MNRIFQAALAATTLLLAMQAAATITFYEDEGFRGRVFASEKQVGNLERAGFNDRASSVIVNRGRWEVCERARFEGRCVVLRPGNYDSLRAMGLDDRLSSMRPVAARGQYANEAPPPVVAPAYEYRRRPNERVYEAPVTSVRAVLGTPQQRCWVEREQVDSARGDLNIAGGVVGALLGGVLGHQVGGGRGKDLATAGGAVAGAAIGANVGRGSSGAYDRDLRRCENTSSGKPEYWDVTYNFRGAEHRIQMTTPPGKTVAVNQKGEPRG
jgi:uncharacterized protein YcfJ